MVKSNKIFKFYKKNFIYDNGIVNILLLLKEKFGVEKLSNEMKEENKYLVKLDSKKYTCNFILTNTYLEIKGLSENKVEKLLKDLFNVEMKKKELIEFTDNEKKYYDRDKEEIVIDKKVNFTGGNCQYFGYQVLKTPSNLVLDEIEKEKKYIRKTKKIRNKIRDKSNKDKNIIELVKTAMKRLNKKESLKDDKILKEIEKKVDITEQCREYIQEYIDYFNYEIKKRKEKIKKVIKKFNKKNDSELSYDGMCKGHYGINVLPRGIEENNKTFINYTFKGEEIKLDSKIHSFIFGKSRAFKDKGKKAKNTISFKDAILYQIGFRSLYYYHNDFYSFPYANSLLDLYQIKSTLDIPYDNVEVKDKDGKKQEINSNFPLDGLSWEYNFNAQNKSDKDLKLLLCLYKEVFNEINEVQDFLDLSRGFYSYDDSGDGGSKSDFEYISKVTKIMKFFRKLEKKRVKRKDYGEDGENFEIKEESLLKLLSFRIIRNNISNLENVDLLLSKFTYNLLRFNSLTDIIMEIQQENLKQGQSSLPKGLKKFINTYLEEQGKEIEQRFNELGKIIGVSLGKFLANIEDKDLIFRLRNIKNEKQLVEYINSVYFKLLKNNNEAGINKKAQEGINEVLKLINSDNWQLIKDYMGIYMIQSYQKVNYAKNQGDSN